MRRKATAAVAALTVVGGLLTTVLPAGADPATDQPSLEVYVGQVDTADLEVIRGVGLDHEDISTGKGRDGKVAVEVVMNERQAEKLAAQGVGLDVKRIRGKKASEVAAAQARAGYEGFRSWSEDGGIEDELRDTAAANPRLTKLVTYGKSVNGQDLLALKVSKNANQGQDGRKPAVLYLGAQHAREWITPEMVRRLMHHFIDGYGKDAEITRLVDTTELWFVPVANPDGYDFTFTPGNRLWRKNLQDNDGDGTIRPGDGVDLNRNFAVKWGWDNEGSSPQPASETYRGPEPNSEPETEALDAFVGQVGFEHFVNYHSAAELLLYGIGWQVNTPSPDDVILEAMVGTDEEPAVEGYDPDISAELYTTNGDTDTHMTVEHGTLGFTPEMTTCQVASRWYDDDEWEPGDCVSGFNFPDDDRLITEEFQKNIPFALSVAKSAHSPADPVTFNGEEAPDMVVDEFAVSHGTEQPVAVVADRQIQALKLNYRVNGGEAKAVKVAEWEGGERYGDTHDDYYAEFRGTVTGTKAGDSVEVWFSGVKPKKGPVSTDPFTYTVAQDIGGDVLVLAAEDYTGVSPVQGVNAPKYADEHVAAIEVAGRSADVYDVDANGRTAPHHLGVLGHYDAIVWETGDDVLPRAVGQPAGTADKLSLDVEIAVRDYLNEGGKAVVAGQYNRFGEAADGVYYYNPFAPPECTTYGAYPCLPLFNDFLQYWLGAFTYVSDGGTDGAGEPYDLVGTEGTPFDGFTGDLNAAGSAQNQEHTASLLTTSSFLPMDDFPQFASQAVVDWARPGGSPFDPRTGEWFVYSQQADVAYKRLTRTIDLTNANSAQLKFWASHQTELDWDYTFVEAHTVGEENWTTLPVPGITSSDTGDSCPEGWHILHPQLERYQGADCSGSNQTTGGEWHAASGQSGGWKEWVVDLSAYAGSQVEVSISYASDWAVQDLGVFVDDATVVVDGVEATTSFEDGLGGWTVAGPPPGTQGNANDWVRTQLAFDEGATVTTDSTVFAGFGLEGLAPAQRDVFVQKALAHLLD
ncbi:MAG TPA: M14 family zinc carboxypeptidase [Jiangellales bacterium]|nr:M14 family zinc carboxypeptidase [Jiangellales bacterium]